MDITVCFNYQKTIEKIYSDARWEAYYDTAIIPLFDICCFGKAVKIVPVHETRKSGRKPLVTKKHFIETYSIEKEVVEKGEKKNRRFGIPDYVIVPLDSTYENPKKSLLNIEFKLPDGLLTEYKAVQPKNYEVELLHQFEYCDNIILTDGVTWYFLEKGNDINNVEPITLYDFDNREWKKVYNDRYSDIEIELLKRITDMIEKVVDKYLNKRK